MSTTVKLFEQDIQHGQAFKVQIRKPFNKKTEMVIMYSFNESGKWKLSENKDNFPNFFDSCRINDFLNNMNSLTPPVSKLEGENYFNSPEPENTEHSVGAPFKAELIDAASLVQHTNSKVIKTPSYYDNSKGSLYKVAQDRGWNAYLFDAVKRLERGSKKDPLHLEIDKTIALLQLWKEEIQS